MRLTMQGEYAIRAMVELARQNGRELISAKELASRQEIPPVFLTKILLILAKAGLVISLRGSRGGIRLAKEPSFITMREIIEAIEGPLRLNMCVSDLGTCRRAPECKVHRVWNKAQESMLRELEINLAELI